MGAHGNVSRPKPTSQIYGVNGSPLSGSMGVGALLKNNGEFERCKVINDKRLFHIVTKHSPMFFPHI
jgi:hypothetical protein